MTMKEWHAYWRKRRRHDRAMRNIGMLAAPLPPAKAALLLPILTWRYVTVFVRPSVMVQIAAGVLLMVIWGWLPSFLGVE